MTLINLSDWTRIEEAPHLLINCKGQVYSSKFKRFLKCRIVGKPGAQYFAIGVVINGKTKNLKVHRLVAKYFIANPLNLPEVNHKDGDKFNNKDWNLEWATHAGNMKHAGQHGLMPQGEGHHRSKLTDIFIAEIRKLLAAGQRQRVIANAFQINQSVVSKINNNKTWKNAPITCK
jgi:hypothetical protein